MSMDIGRGLDQLVVLLVIICLIATLSGLGAVVAFVLYVLGHHVEAYVAFGAGIACGIIGAVRYYHGSK